MEKIRIFRQNLDFRKYFAKINWKIKSILSGLAKWGLYFFINKKDIKRSFSRPAETDPYECYGTRILISWLWREKERHFSFSKILNRLPPPGCSQEQMEKACRHKISCLISTTRATFVFVFENQKLALLVWKRLMLGFYPTSLPFERAWSILSKTLQQRREEEMYWCWRRPQNAETIQVDIYRRKIFIADKSVADAKYFSPQQQQQLLISPISIILSLTLLETKSIVEPKTANTFWRTFALDKKN